MHKNKRFLLSDLEKFGPQRSLDLEADIRFAKFVDPYAVKELEKQVEQGTELLGGYISARRLRTLRGLVKMGLVITYWEGTEKEGRKELGICRVKVYKLASSYVPVLVRKNVKSPEVENFSSNKVGYDRRVTLRRRISNDR